MNAYETISRHPFVRRVMDEARPWLLDSLSTLPRERSQLGAWRARNRAALSPAARYLHSVMWRTFNLVRMFEVLARSRYLLHRAPSFLRSKSEPLTTRNEWTQYHFLVFTACLPGIVDCCLLLTADAYQLGVPARLCSFDLVTSHDFLVKAPVVRGLKTLRKGLERHIQRRHRYLHRGEEPDFGELTDSDWIMDLRQITFLQGVGAAAVDRRVLSGAWRETLRTLRPLLDSAERAAVDGTDGVLRALEPAVLGRLKLLGRIQ